MRPIIEIASRLQLVPEDLRLNGPHLAKLTYATLKRLTQAPPTGALVLVTALTPTKHGEGKTTVSIGLAQGLAARRRKAVLALREPSMGPVFGMKGGGTGGGRASVVPSADINLHFTGDLHAITAANNLLAAIIDNALHFRLEPAPDARRVTWRRVLDVNDRSLRHVVLGLGGTMDGIPRESAFDITAASEIMALLCLSSGVTDLKERLGRLVVGFDAKDKPLTAAALGAVGPMAATLRDALLPNLVQSSDGVPALVHGGPFANIAHGCNSIMATRAALGLGEFVVTEAGFASDLGMEKFFDIKCRTAGLWPRAVVVVVTSRALRAHGGDAELKATGAEVRGVLEKGMPNLERHVANVRRFGFDPVIAINVFDRDTEDELATIEKLCADRGLTAARCEGYARGGEGAMELGAKVEQAAARPQPEPRFLYPLEASAQDKVRAIARDMYGANEVAFSDLANRAIARFEGAGYGKLPICVAKTPLSFSDDPGGGGNPAPFTLHVRDVALRAGAGYLLALTGEIQTLPGLPRVPNANRIDLTEDGEIVGVQ
jgi:formate--tetrahydrofolate ligase